MALLLAGASTATVLAHHNDSHGANGTTPSMPDAAVFGLCMAWQHNANGRDHGNAGNAGPFRWLQEQADSNDQTVEEFCSEVTRPGPP